MVEPEPKPKPKRRIRKPIESTSKNPRGRMKKGRSPITPGVLAKIASMYLKGATKMDIAREVGVDRKTVTKHLEERVKPAWKEEQIVSVTEDLARISMIERMAWDRFEKSCSPQTKKVIKQALVDGVGKLRIVEKILSQAKTTGETHWVNVIQWCIEFRAKVGGYYAASKLDINHGGELRVAGMTPGEVDEAMLTRLVAGVEKRKRFSDAQLEMELN
ncbi:MAG: hypothetical protein GY832_01455 [Chloroflexi bacterium]|nr:hypothetical protein [Chloroflexota bacterium]